MKKVISILLFLIICVGIMSLYSCDKDKKIDKEISDQKADVMRVYNENTQTINCVKDFFLSEKPDVNSINDDGSITLKNGESYYPETIKSDIVKIKSIDISHATCSMYYLNQATEIFMAYWYFDSTQMEIGLAYSESDLSESDEFYTHINDNWYMYAAGMT